MAKNFEHLVGHLTEAENIELLEILLVEMRLTDVIDAIKDTLEPEAQAELIEQLVSDQDEDEQDDDADPVEIALDMEQ